MMATMPDWIFAGGWACVQRRGRVKYDLIETTLRCGFGELALGVVLL